MNTLIEWDVKVMYLVNIMIPWKHQMNLFWWVFSSTDALELHKYSKSQNTIPKFQDIHYNHCLWAGKNSLILRWFVELKSSDIVTCLQVHETLCLLEFLRSLGICWYLRYLFSLKHFFFEYFVHFIKLRLFNSAFEFSKNMFRSG